MTIKWLGGGADNDNGQPSYTRVMRYVHSGNSVVYPASVDLATGIFTAKDPIALAAGTHQPMIVVFPDVFPDKLFPEWNGLYDYQLHAIDQNTFYLYDNTNKVDVTSYTDVGLDITQLSFEYGFPNYGLSVDISKLDLGRNFKICTSSPSNRPGWRSVRLNYQKTDGTTDSCNWNQVDGRAFMQFYAEQEAHWFPERNEIFYCDGKQISKTWSGGSSWGYSSSIGGARTFTKARIAKFTTLTIGFGLANGAVADLYTG